MEYAYNTMHCKLLISQIGYYASPYNTGHFAVA